MIRLVEVQKNLSGYSLGEVYINPKHVVAMRQDDKMIRVLEEGSLPELDERQSFTKLYIDRGHTGIDITVVGALQHIKEKLGINTKTLLKG
jgi:hypothetical protein